MGEYFLVPVISLAAEFWMIWSFPSWDMFYKRILQWLLEYSMKGLLTDFVHGNGHLPNLGPALAELHDGVVHHLVQPRVAYFFTEALSQDTNSLSGNLAILNLKNERNRRMETQSITCTLLKNALCFMLKMKEQ